MKPNMSNKSNLEEKKCNHEIMWKAGFHLDDEKHPTLKDQFCMNCKKTLYDIISSQNQQLLEKLEEAHDKALGHRDSGYCGGCSEYQRVLDDIKQKIGKGLWINT